MDKANRTVQNAWRLLSATRSNLVRPGCLPRVRATTRHWLYQSECRLPAKYLVDPWPAMRHMRAHVSVSFNDPGELPYGERAIMDALVRHLRPRNLFEFGTFRGATTRLLADAAPEGAVVHTLDLPNDAFGADSREPEVIGREFRDKPGYRGRIISHRCDSRGFDFGPFRGRMDFVFVDASHEYPDIRHDSRRALEMVSPGGVVVWDDCDPSYLGVARALNQLAAHAELVHVASSRLVVHRHGGPSGSA